jgi:hypothetical protein
MKQLYAMREYNINMFIDNTKKEMLNIRDIMYKQKQEEYSLNMVEYKNKDQPVHGHYFTLEALSEEQKKYLKKDPHYFTENYTTTTELISNIPKILVIIACHLDNSLRLKAFISIMMALSKIDNIDIIIANSTQTLLSDYVQNTFKNKYLKYIEINNDSHFGFSKWYYGIINTDITKYKFVTFMNDSIIIHSDITHFFDFTRFKNVDLYGYNDSSQEKYHYQSYLFSIKVDALHNFFRLLNDNTKYVRSYNDAVVNYELKMIDYFSNKDCFLKIAHYPFQKGKNIFVQNDFLYYKLKNKGLLPFSKLKRILHS